MTTDTHRPTIADDGTEGLIEVIGARVNNLKNINVAIPTNRSQ